MVIFVRWFVVALLYNSILLYQFVAHSMQFSILSSSFLLSNHSGVVVSRLTDNARDFSHSLNQSLSQKVSIVRITIAEALFFVKIFITFIFSVHSLFFSIPFYFLCWISYICWLLSFEKFDSFQECKQMNRNKNKIPCISLCKWKLPIFIPTQKELDEHACADSQTNFTAFVYVCIWMCVMQYTCTRREAAYIYSQWRQNYGIESPKMSVGRSREKNCAKAKVVKPHK